MHKGKYIVPLLLIAVAVIIFSDISSTAEAAGLTPSYDNKYINQGVGLETFDTGFKEFVKGILSIMRPIVSILTVVAGLQLAFGISDGKKTIWNWILGAGLAISFADFVYSSDVFGSFIQNDTHYVNDIDKFHPDIKNNPQANADFLSHFMAYYKDGIILKGAEAIKGVCIKLLLILFTINCSMKLALDLVSGDKIKFLISETLKAGFYIFLITNWLTGMGLTTLMSNGFQEIGFLAGGDPSPTSATLNPDSIWNNGVKLLTAMLNLITSKASVFDLSNTLLMIITFLVACYCIIMISIEMFMVRIEFLTIALLAMPLLAFAMIEQFNFLAQKAIGAVFNLALKCCVIAFIQAISVPYFTAMVDQIVEIKSPANVYDAAKITLNGELSDAIGGSFMAFATLILGLFVILMLTRKLPDLVSGLLNGNPALSGSSMTGMAMGAAGGIATTAGVLNNMPGGSSGGGKNGGGDTQNQGTPLGSLERTADNSRSSYTDSINRGIKDGAQKAAIAGATMATGGLGSAAAAGKEVTRQGGKELAKNAVKDSAAGKTGASKSGTGTSAGDMGGKASRTGDASGNDIPERSADGNVQGPSMDSKGGNDIPDWQVSYDNTRMPENHPGSEEESAQDTGHQNEISDEAYDDEAYDSDTRQSYYQPNDIASSMRQDAEDKEENNAEAPAVQTAGDSNSSNEEAEGQTASAAVNTASNMNKRGQAVQSSGSGNISQAQQGRRSTSNNGGSKMGYLAKAILMTTPAGGVVRAYEKGRGLAGDFDKAVGNTREEFEVKQKSPEEEKKDLLVNLLIEDYSRKMYNEPPPPPPGGNINNDDKNMTRT